MKIIIYISSFLILLIDQLSKNIIIKNLKLNEARSVLGDFFSIHYVQNSGAAFNILDGRSLILISIAVIVIVYLIYQSVFNKKISKLELAGNLIMIAGIIGNLIDRVRFGYVIDFIGIQIMGYHLPIFNIADVFICLGAIFLLFDLGLRGEKNEKLHYKI